MQIWKYPLKDGNSFRISMPDGAKILSAQAQYGVPTLWVLVDPVAPRTPRMFSVWPTGGDIPRCSREFIGTVQLHNGDFVVHVFEDHA